MSDDPKGTLSPTLTPPPKRVGIDEPVSLPTTGADRYVIDRELGQGGQSVVFAAKDQSLGRDVALKTARQRGEAAGSFIREARITGQLEHPGIVPVHELGRTEGGEYYCTQKLVRGRTFRTALEEAQTLEARLALLPHFIDLCHAVAYAHSRGVVHRDLKPENVMVGEFGETVVLDWGIARVLGGPDEVIEESTTAEKVLPLQTVRRLDGVISGSTQRGSVMGTPLYMSPEQARGENDQVDPRSDVWSLGVMLYELLAFVRPFEGTNVRALLLDVGRGHFRPLGDVAPEAPPELVAIVDQAMQVERAKRPEDARALAAQLSDFRAGKRVSAYQYSSWDLVKRFVVRNRALTAVSLAGLVVLGISELYAWSLVGARDRALLESKTQVTSGLLAQAGDAERLLDWNRASALHAKAAVEGDARERLAEQVLAAWVSPVVRVAGELPTPASGAGSFDVESGRAFLGAPGKGLFSLEASQPWRLLEGTSDPERRALPNAIAPGGRSWVIKSATLRLNSGASLPGTEKAVLVAYSPDGTTLAVASPGGVRIHDGATGALRVELSEGPDEPTALTLANSGAVAIAGADRTLRWWDSYTKPEFTRWMGPRFRAIAFSADGGHVFAADEGGGVEVLLRDPSQVIQVTRTLRAHQLPVQVLAVSPTGKSLATASIDGAVVVWDLATGNAVSRLQAEGTELRALSYSGDGLKLGALERSGDRLTWDVSRLSNARPLVTLEEGPAWSLSAATGGGIWARTAKGLMLLSPDGDVLWERPDVRGGEALVTELGLLIGKPGQLDLHSTADGEVLESTHPCRATVWSVVSAGNATRWLACGTELRTLSADQTEATASGLHARTPIRHLAISPSGERLAYVAEDGSGALVSLPAAKEQETWSGRQGQAIAFEVSGKWLVSAGEEGVVLRNGVSGYEVRRLSASDLRVRALGFALEGAVVWAAGAEGVTFWTVDDGAVLVRLPGLHGELSAAVMSDDRKSIWLADSAGRIFKTGISP